MSGAYHRSRTYTSNPTDMVMVHSAILKQSRNDCNSEKTKLLLWMSM